MEISAQSLAFVARRLLAERVALAFSVRTPPVDPQHDAWSALPELEVRGLRDDEARTLLDSVMPGRLDERVRERIIAETRENPLNSLALLELTRGLSTAELAGGFGRPDARPLASQIEQSFVRRSGGLSDAAQGVLLAAAAEPVG
ncbi:LuxR family transcriptional regulator, partial [Streptomyces tendae]